jgi:hypothetical protein
MPTHPVYMINPYRKKRVAKREYKPKRNGRRKKQYKGLPKEFAKNMRKYNTINCEKKIMTMNNYLNGLGSAGYLQDLPAASLNNAGLINSALTCVVLQTGRQLTQLNSSLNSTTGQTICSALDGYSVLQGDTQNRLVGSYGKITSSYINLNITMDPVQQGNEENYINSCLPHQFRLIQVKARREKMVSPGAQVASYGVPSIATNLFRDEAGGAQGINAECATQDVFTWFVNKQFWTVIKDERFTLSAPSYLSASSVNFQYAPNVNTHKSSRFKKYWLPKPKTKVRFEANSVDGLIKQEVVDFNYVTHTIILCKNASSGERPSNHWSVQANGATQFIDE